MFQTEMQYRHHFPLKHLLLFTCTIVTQHQLTNNQPYINYILDKTKYRQNLQLHHLSIYIVIDTQFYN